MTTKLQRSLHVGSAILIAVLSGQAFGAPSSPEYDVVYQSARAIDPETRLDGIRNIGVTGGRIMAVSAAPLTGRRVIDARGLVAAPGFIDLHSHATSYDTATYEAKDGVTTRLELELGVFPVKAWYLRKQGHELLNFGASVSHNLVRAYLQVGGDPATFDRPDLREKLVFTGGIHDAIPDAAYARLQPLLEQGLRDGALGIGSGTQYAPGITYREMLDVTRVAGNFHTCVFTHVRFGSLVEPGSTLESIQENIANAAITGACVHIVHINSMAMGDAPMIVGLMHDARAHGIDISTETYPWNGSNDEIRSVIFDPGWQKRWGVTYGDLQSRTTGKRLTQQDFDTLRSGTGDDGVIMHMNTEATIIKLLQDPLVLIASDALDIEGQNSHPRAAGTFARVLGHYVRTARALSLTDAIRKMALMPAQRLEAFSPTMKHKGRLQVGADADIVLFDPDTVDAGADYGHAKEYSKGFQYVMVGGVLIVDHGNLVRNIYPGQPVYSSFRQP